MKQKVFNILISVCVVCLGILQYLGYTTIKKEAKESNNEVEVKVKIVDKEPEFLNKSPEEGLMEALLYYNVKHPEIVYAQAILETGNFKSQLCTEHNNLFGLYNSGKGKYFKYNHWSESVKDYRDKVQYKYKPPDNYYDFLLKIGYAEDPKYISKLKKIVK